GAVLEIDDPRFYDAYWEHAPPIDPNVARKGDRMIALVPGDVRTIVDVGAGDGYLAHRLVERFDVTAIDRSAAALAPVRCRAIRASADALPLEDGSFDLALASEILEHLPSNVLGGAARELDRVARRWILVSVPHAENLRRRIARCPTCRLAFHVDGHL